VAEQRSPIAALTKIAADYRSAAVISTVAVAAILSMAVTEPPTSFGDHGTISWLVDSGSGVTCTPDRAHFHTYQPYGEHQSVTDAGGGKHTVAGSGAVRLRVSTDSGPQILVIEGVLHIPSFVLPILSTKRMRAQGYGISLPANAPGHIRLPSNDSIHLAEGMDGLEYLEGAVPIDTDTAPLASVHATRYEDVREWAVASDPEDLIYRIAHPHASDTEHTKLILRRALAKAAIYMPVEQKHPKMLS
jgi:hypothetical protein